MNLAVYSLGNVLYGDDAVGPTVLETLKLNWSWPEELTVDDLGTPGFDLARCLANHDRVLVIDAVHVGKAPGTVVSLDDAQILASPKVERLSPHDPVLADAISLARLGGETPRQVHFIGVQPGNLEQGAVGLSREVRAAVPLAVLAVVQVLDSWGVTLVEKRRGTLEPWWEKAAEQVTPLDLTPYL